MESLGVPEGLGVLAALGVPEQERIVSGPVGVPVGVTSTIELPARSPAVEGVFGVDGCCLWTGSSSLGQKLKSFQELGCDASSPTRPALPQIGVYDVDHLVKFLLDYLLQAADNGRGCDERLTKG